MNKKIQYTVGIDEAGRGPLAGPVSVGVAVIPGRFDWKLIPDVNDSKKLKERKRKEIFNIAKKLKKEKKLDYSVSLVGASMIDKIGISKAVSLGMSRSLKRLNLNPKEVDVRLDGLLFAPPAYKKQRTIIRGDSKEKVIGLASILAKVTRDEYMIRIARDYTKYDLEIHKGYGTKKHREAVKKHGLKKIHRKSFCANRERW